MSTAPEQHRIQSVDRNRVDLRCRTCGYGIVVKRPPPPCPMCGGRAWRELPSKRDRTGL